MPVEGGRRSYLRDSNGPRAVDERETRTSSRRHHKETPSDEREPKRTKRSSNTKTSKSETSHRRKLSGLQASGKPSVRPSFELDIIGQPCKTIPLGADVEASIMVSLRFPSADKPISAANIDSSRLFAVSSLITETRSGERVPVEPGVMTGQKLFDSVHPLPEQYAASLECSQPCRLSLGYCTFSGLLIRQSGMYRIRTALIQMPGEGSTAPGATTILTVDSDVIKVERRSVQPSRGYGRVHI
nr:hypothetical protein B0A51_05685 [Rachicladosporium sp. CCFEE 5018]